MASVLPTPRLPLLPRGSSPPSTSHPVISRPLPATTFPASSDSGSRSRTRFAARAPSARTRRAFSVKAAADPAASPVFDPLEAVSEVAVALRKIKLLNAVSGLNRGLAANEEDLKKADAAAKDLEDAGGPVDLSNTLDKLQGRWRLIYSSAFSSRTLGGSRPGPPVGRLLPITLGQVYQRIDILNKDFDNIVELQFGTPWPLPTAEATATLAHKFELIGSSKIKITFTNTTVKPTGNLSQLPPLEIPRLPDGLRPPSNTGSGEFDVTYIDSEMRITRGDRGELRVFVIS